MILGSLGNITVADDISIYIAPLISFVHYLAFGPVVHTYLI